MKGAYFGLFDGHPAESESLCQQIGKTPAVYAHYLGWTDPFPDELCQRNAKQKRITLLTWEYNPQLDERFQNRSLDALIDGHFDAYLEEWAQRIVNFAQPVLLRWGHEMNGTWFQWAGANNGGGSLTGFGNPQAADGPERFAAAYRYLHDRFEGLGANNLLWVWCPTAPFVWAESLTGSEAWNRAENYYPGDAYVDWLGMDGYNWGSSDFGEQLDGKWESFDEIFKESYERLTALNPEKPILIGEFSSSEEGGDKGRWIADAFERLENEYPHIKAVVWFHIDKETDWRLNSSPESLDAARKALAGNPYWLKSWPEMR
jgi:beta-mannanase